MENKKVAVLVGVGKNKVELNNSLLELENLALANDIDTIEVFKQHLDKINSFGYVQKGKLQEISDFINENDVDLLIANDELTASTIQNIKERVNVEVIDRTSLILDIFKKRAKTSEAILQVQIASLSHDLAHLVLKDESYDQQRGGAHSNKGAGERKIEKDRRVIKERIHHLKQELNDVVKARNQQKKLRKKNEMLLVSLVGYTNAGKSTIMNNLVNDDINKKVIEKNMLFATLDTSVRKIYLPNHREVLLSDTVGFIDKLPHQLITSFKSTLEEAVLADLIVHVVDYSNPNYKKHIEVTNNTLKEIGVLNDVKMLYVYNKADNIIDMKYPSIEKDKVIISAKESSSIDLLKKEISNILYDSIEEVSLVIPYSNSSELDYLYKKTKIIKEEHLETSHYLIVELTKDEKERFSRYLINE